MDFTLKFEIPGVLELVVGGDEVEFPEVWAAILPFLPATDAAPKAGVERSAEVTDPPPAAAAEQVSIDSAVDRPYTPATPEPSPPDAPSPAPVVPVATRKVVIGGEVLSVDAASRRYGAKPESVAAVCAPSGPHRLKGLPVRWAEPAEAASGVVAAPAQNGDAHRAEARPRSSGKSEPINPMRLPASDGPPKQKI